MLVLNIILLKIIISEILQDKKDFAAYHLVIIVEQMELY